MKVVYTITVSCSPNTFLMLTGVYKKNIQYTFHHALSHVGHGCTDITRTIRSFQCPN